MSDRWIIRNSRDLRSAYSVLMGLYAIDGITDEYEAVRTIKAGIRKYFKQESKRRIIDSDYDGYIELIELPDVEDPKAYFEENEYRHYRPSAYDCTGQLFTQWYKIFQRNGKTMAYHSVGIDV